MKKREFRAVCNRRQIMLDAHRFYRDGRMGDFATCLRHAWENHKAYVALCNALGEYVKSWFGWTQLGREVIHKQTNVGQIRLWGTFANGVTRVMSYFKYEQTCELGTQEDK